MKIAKKLNWFSADSRFNKYSPEEFVKLFITRQFAKEVIQEFLKELEKQGFVIIKKTERENTFLV